MLIALQVMRDGNGAVFKRIGVWLQKRLPPLRFLLNPGNRSQLHPSLSGYKMTYPAALLRMILCALTMGLSFAAIAADYPAKATWSGAGGAYTSASSCLSAIESSNSSLGNCGGYGSWERDIKLDSASTTGHCNNGSSGTAAFSCTANFTCPSGGALTYSSGTYICKNAPACPDGYIVNASGQCAPPSSPCKAGLDSSMELPPDAPTPSMDSNGCKLSNVMCAPV